MPSNNRWLTNPTTTHFDSNATLMQHNSFLRHLQPRVQFIKSQSSCLIQTLATRAAVLALEAIDKTTTDVADFTGLISETSQSHTRKSH